MEKIYELQKYVKFSLYTVGQFFVLQLFDMEFDANDNVPCIWENDNLALEHLLNEAIEWCKDRYGDKSDKPEETEDFCEWKPLTTTGSFISNHGEHDTLKNVEAWDFCPYCGKKIKIIY